MEQVTSPTTKKMLRSPMRERPFCFCHATRVRTTRGRFQRFGRSGLTAWDELLKLVPRMIALEQPAGSERLVTSRPNSTEL